MAESFIPVNGTNPAKSLHTRTHTLDDGTEVHDEVIDQGIKDEEVAIALLLM